MKIAAQNTNSRRKILIIDDNELNRDILSALLEDDYDTVTAENGQTGMNILQSDYASISLIILDVYMPVMDGFEFLQLLRSDVMLSTVPVLVATSADKQEMEEKCLELGASDFVTKPYKPKLVKARIKSLIRLRESVHTLSEVEYDELTGLYTLPAFYHHAEYKLKEEPNRSFDLIVGDIQEFKLVNSVFGEKKGDEVLKYVGGKIKEIMDVGVSARSGDKFFCLFPSEHRYSAKAWKKESKDIIKGAPVPNLTIKYGLYEDVDKTQPISIICDRAILASASVKHDYTKDLAMYDASIINKRIENQKMEAAFESALAAGEFVVWYQPKVDIVTGEIVAAEALVRWIDGNGHMISPGAFIPLFEADGIIGTLDMYMFEKVCQFQKHRMDTGRKIVPVSVNLSRSSIYKSETIDSYIDMASRNSVPGNFVPIELTESAAIDGKGILELANKLVQAGFPLHMDDFGSGYSSLHSLSTLPFDVIKLDKSLTDQIGDERGNIIIRHMVEIAQEFGMKVVAEGVEHEDQIAYLRSVGCDMVQGYYYSKPVNQETYEEMLESNKSWK